MIGINKMPFQWFLISMRKYKKTISDFNEGNDDAQTMLRAKVKCLWPSPCDLWVLVIWHGCCPDDMSIWRK